MRLLTLGYYDDFSRFFLALHNSIANSKDGLISEHLAINLSGYLYWRLRSKNVSFVNPKITSREPVDTYQGISIQDCIEYEIHSEKKGTNMTK